MSQTDTGEPDWGAPLSLQLTPGGISHALFYSATAVHTGWSSCVDSALVMSDLYAVDGGNGNYCRLAEQEFTEDGSEEIVWHDWVVEVRVGSVYVTGHWQVQTSASLIDWEWSAREAEAAFEKGCVLFGKRTRRGLVVEEPAEEAPAPKRTAH